MNPERELEGLLDGGSAELPRIYSPAEVLELFSPAVRPSIRVLIEKARATGHFSKMGRKVVFTRQNIGDLIEALSCRPRLSRGSSGQQNHHTGAYERALALIERKAKESKEAARLERDHGARGRRRTT